MLRRSLLPRDLSLFCEIGAHLAEWWNLPDIIVQAIRWHHGPGSAENEKQAVSIVHVGDALSYKFGMGNRGSFEPPKVDRKTFSDLNLKEAEVPALKQTAEQSTGV